MKKENANNCWDYYDCSSEKRATCPAYSTNMGRECWIVVNSFSKFKSNERLDKEKRNCWDCSWFKKTSQGFVNCEKD